MFRYNALSKSTSRINMNHSSALIDAIFSIDWWASPKAVLDSYSKLLIQLLTAHPSLLTSTFSMLVATFTCLNEYLQKNAMETAAQESAEWKNSMEQIDLIHEASHNTIEQILKLSPSSSNLLQSALVQGFPHKRLPVIVQEFYIKNLLRVSEYSAALRDNILELIVNQLIQIDVEIINQQPGDGKPGHNSDESDTETCDRTFFDMDDVPKAPDPSIRIRQMADKLDSMMFLMFAYLNLVRAASVEERLLEKPSEEPRNESLQSSDLPPYCGTVVRTLNMDEGKSRGVGTESKDPRLPQLFVSLLRVFDRAILRTHNSRFTQFLVFYVCSFEQKFANDFVHHLLTLIFDTHKYSPIERNAAACYLASFLARASFLWHATIVLGLTMLARWTAAYLREHTAHLTKAVPPEVHVIITIIFFFITTNIIIIIYFHYLML
jgi:RNA polymerase I-specific transcription initiation factor RRN3